MSKNPRDLYQVSRILDRRYGCGDLLLELFHDHNAISAVETLISCGPEETGGEDSDSWNDLMNAEGNVDLEAARFGAYAEFLKSCAQYKLDGRKVFSAFCDSHAYWGDNFECWETLERCGDVANGYVDSGRKYLKSIRKERA